MNDYSDILYLTIAMVIFSMLTVNTARSFLSTSDTVVRSDLEYRALVRAQDEIDEVKLISREDEDWLDPNDFDYIYKNHPVNVVEIYGPNNEYEDRYILDGSSSYINEGDPHVRRYLVTIVLTNTSVEPNLDVTLTYIKSFAR